jgi:CheY-like chemotaxis protein
MCNHVVMVIDDDAEIRETVTDLLSDEGYSIVTAANGLDALNQLRERTAPPCVILLDLMMPVMSGAQFYVAKQGDARLAPIPVVIFSAGARPCDYAGAFACEYLEKPLRLDTLLAAIRRHCE